METALSTLSRWTADCGLGVDPEKTKQVLFTKKYKIPNLTLPKLHQTRPTLNNQAKCLGFILDKKLHCTDNILYRARKAAIALFACKKAIGRKWGFSPVIVHWLYTAIVRPIPLYETILWWPSLEKNINLRVLHKWDASHHRHWSTKHNSRPPTPGPTCQKLGICNSAKAPRSSCMDNRLYGSLQYPNKPYIHTTY